MHGSQPFGCRSDIGTATGHTRIGGPQRSDRLRDRLDPSQHFEHALSELSARLIGISGKVCGVAEPAKALPAVVHVLLPRERREAPKPPGTPVEFVVGICV